MSIAKLYIADYVLQHGERSDRQRVVTMLETSDDAIADELFNTYPESIDDVAERYNLHSTSGNGYWGTSVTSTYDIVSFIAQKRATDPESPLFTGMIHAEKIAADGYRQDFGTSILPNVLGSKWGWSSEGELHSSVSFGADFIIAAAITGDAHQLSGFVTRQMRQIESISTTTATAPLAESPRPAAETDSADSDSSAAGAAAEAVATGPADQAARK